MGQKLLAQQDVIGSPQQSGGGLMCISQALGAQVLVEHQVGDVLVELRQVVDDQQPVAGILEALLISCVEVIAVQRHPGVGVRCSVCATACQSRGSLKATTSIPSPINRRRNASLSQAVMKITLPAAACHACASARQRMTWPVPMWLLASARIRSGGRVCST